MNSHSSNGWGLCYSRTCMRHTYGCHSQVFSEDSTGDMQFDDFLDMLSVFSENATKEVKSTYAFRIFGACWRPAC